MRYLLLTLKHKWFVFLAGLKIGVPLWRLILHDWSKLLPNNLLAYNRQFFGKADRPEEFIVTWLKHQNTHDHHWEYWIPRTGHNRCNPPYKDNKPIPMSINATKEMVADWLGASRAYEGKWPREDWPWFKSNWDNIKERLHPDTIACIINLLQHLNTKMEYHYSNN